MTNRILFTSQLILTGICIIALSFLFANRLNLSCFGHAHLYGQKDDGVVIKTGICTTTNCLPEMCPIFNTKDVARLVIEKNLI